MEYFWNPQDEQIPKLSLVNQFEQDLKKKTGEKDVHFLVETHSDIDCRSNDK